MKGPADATSAVVALLLALSSALDIIAGVFFALVGRALVRRQLDGDARDAALMFAVWWFGLAGLVAAGGFALDGGLLGIAVALDPHPGSGLLLAFALAWIALACAAVWGILCYLLYLFRGWRVGRALAVAYAMLLVLFALIAIREEPIGVATTALGVSLVYARPVTGLSLLALLLFLEAPQIGGAIAYGTVVRAAPTREARRRIIVVSSSLTVWFALSLLLAALRVETQDAWILVLRLVGLAAALAILLAYRPAAEP